MQDKSGQTLAPTLDIDSKIIADTSAEEMATYFEEKSSGILKILLL